MSICVVPCVKAMFECLRDVNEELHMPINHTLATEPEYSYSYSECSSEN